ncbi:MAG: hypothetical protein NVSMB13_16070 [Mycobacteriales bacterium]
MPIRWQVRMTRRAISPRLATSTLSNTRRPSSLDRHARRTPVDGAASETSRMGLVVVVMAASLLLGTAVGGSWRRLARIRLHDRGWLVLAAFVQLAGALAAGIGRLVVTAMGRRRRQPRSTTRASASTTWGSYS